MDVQHIWRAARGWYGAIQEDNIFEPRIVALHPDGSFYKIRSTITGHGQNGEFTPREHYINIAGGDQDFQYDVWNECATIPIFPQGGTWLFDRAGWCPGDPSTTFEFDITDIVSAGDDVEIDYGVNGAYMNAANYLVANQLVTYGPANFSLDAAIVDVIRPSQKIEYDRFNPACNMPAVIIQNTGTTLLESLTIIYRVLGGNELSYEWTGALDFMETTEVILPVEEVTFWALEEGEDGVFEVNIHSPNGGVDQYNNNNSMQSPFNALGYVDYPIRIKIKTNNEGHQNAYTLKDGAGNIILERDDLEDNTIYNDDITLPPGCYAFEFTDSADDGLYYWFTPENGSGSVKIQRIFDETLFINIKTFEPEFGRFHRYDFVVPALVDQTNNIESVRLLSVFPNPTSDVLNIELMGYEKSKLTISLYDAMGRLLKLESMENIPEHHIESWSIENLENGIYFLQVNDGQKINTHRVLKQ